MVRIRTFDEALAHAEEHTDVASLLLGNGFSIDYAPEIFHYESLAAEASLSGLSVTKQELFEALGSSNFEVVIDRLRAAAALEIVYGGSTERASTMKADARVVRNGLADVLADRHPARAQHLEDDEITHARLFLSHFTNIFTLNYDLLLYWALMAREYGSRVPTKDGFGWVSGRDRRLVWSSNPSRTQRVFFLHGALHLFVEDHRLYKLSYNENGPIIRSLRQRLSRGEYPLVVTEGTREEKEARIGKSAYLRFGIARFRELGGSLFIHGASLSPNDDHIIEHLESAESDVVALYVGIHGDPEAGAAREVVARAKEIVRRRRAEGGRRLKLKFYDASSAKVWREG
ncbi:DUF4917 family protein [Microbacterium hydrocarbonoxydans]|uniref:DUF4917 domain-containing protein n=1 Tax=Microbacterium hydrocarbonoxydans TaxID=273678 RepID=A0A1H4MDU1_9MICO|nr:DUF4917 family protein [Microbacterium hydrocarbonoxydans]SEB81251.1 protein of unknown function [Microbacterium hydrocarbonoxydans]